MRAARKPHFVSSPAPPGKWDSRSSIKIPGKGQAGPASVPGIRVSHSSGGICPAHSLESMPSGPRISDVENITTLDIDAQHHGLKRPGEGHRVLLLEDRADFRQILHDYLVSNTYQVTAVQSGV